MWRHHFSTVFDGRPILPSELYRPQPPTSGVSPGPVPDLVGLPSADARRVAREAHLAVALDERHASEGLWGRVLAQDPPAGTLGVRDSIVTLTVGARPRVPVPDVRGRDEDEALSILREAGLGTARRAIRSSDRVPEGCVVRTRPRPGATVPSGSRISYVVAAAPRQTGVTGRRRGRRAPRAVRLADGSFLLADKGLDRPRR